MHKVTWSDKTLNHVTQTARTKSHMHDMMRKGGGTSKKAPPPLELQHMLPPISPTRANEVLHIKSARPWPAPELKMYRLSEGGGGVRGEEGGRGGEDACDLTSPQQTDRQTRGMRGKVSHTAPRCINPIQLGTVSL